MVATGETVWYTGDTSMMAPQVEEAVQDYVDEVHSKAVAIVPLKEPHDKTDPLAQPKVLGALIIEQIEDSRPRDGLLQRIEVVSEHSSIALANVLEHHELFLMPVWRAIGKSRWLVEARQLPWTISITLGVLLVLLVLFLWPANFDLSAKGTLQPAVQREIFATSTARSSTCWSSTARWSSRARCWRRLRNSELEGKFVAAMGNLNRVRQELSAANRSLSDSRAKLTPGERVRKEGERNKLLDEEKSYQLQLQLLDEDKKNLTIRSPIDGQLVTWQVHELLIHRVVERGQVMMKIVEPQGDWELEVHMPEDQMGFVNDARKKLGEKLSVEYRTQANPGVSHEGTVKEIHRTAEIRGEEGNTVLIRVAIDKADLASDLRPGAAITAKVHVGRASLGYVWFHDLISFVQMKVLFRWF